MNKCDLKINVDAFLVILIIFLCYSTNLIFCYACKTLPVFRRVSCILIYSIRLCRVLGRDGRSMIVSIVSDNATRYGAARGPHRGDRDSTTRRDTSADRRSHRVSEQWHRVTAEPRKCPRHYAIKSFSLPGPDLEGGPDGLEPT